MKQLNYVLHPEDEAALITGGVDFVRFAATLDTDAGTIPKAALYFHMEDGRIERKTILRPESHEL